MTAKLELLPALLDVEGIVGDDMTVTITVVDDDAAAVDLSSYTIEATVRRGDATVATFGDSVGGAESNVLTLTLTDTQTTAIGTLGSCRWTLSMTTGSDTRQWVSGEFTLHRPGSGGVASGSTTATLTVDTGTPIRLTAAVAAGSGSSGIASVVEDTTPQLGGALDVNGQEITGAIDLHSTGDIIAELGDAAGTNKLSVRDSAGTEQAAIDSDGNITTNGTVDGRDIAADGGKLDTVETNADVTDATNVDAAGAVMEADYDANTILAATTDNTPAALTVAEQTLVGRITAGNIAALTAAQIRTLLNVEDGATADQSAADIRGLGFFDTSNDGTGSGLDADLLDGNEATAFELADADILRADTSDTLTAGFDSDDYALGTISSGTVTPAASNGENFIVYTNNGAHTLAPPTNSGVFVIQVTNAASAGAITTSGFTLLDGDAYATTNGQTWLFVVTKCGSSSVLTIKDLN